MSKENKITTKYGPMLKGQVDFGASSPEERKHGNVAKRPGSIDQTTYVQSTSDKNKKAKLAPSGKRH